VILCALNSCPKQWERIALSLPEFLGHGRGGVFVLCDGTMIGNAGPNGWEAYRFTHHTCIWTMKPDGSTIRRPGITGVDTGCSWGYEDQPRGYGGAWEWPTQEEVTAVLNGAGLCLNRVRGLVIE
jgi:hypothetical protein